MTQTGFDRCCHIKVLTDGHLAVLSAFRLARLEPVSMTLICDYRMLDKIDAVIRTEYVWED